MKITVITVCFNAEACIEKTIRSVTAQKYDDFEYVVIDGKSRDGTVEIIRKHDSAISKWISEEDTGIYNAMNKGVRMANGDYCLFMNAGDMLAHPLSLKQASLFLDDGWDILVGAEITVRNGKQIDYVKPPKTVDARTLINGSLSHQSAFIKRQLLLEYPYDEDLRLVSDWKFWIETILRHKCSYCPIAVDVSVFNHDGLTFSIQNSKSHTERMAVLNEMFNRGELDAFQYRANAVERLLRRIKNKTRKMFHVFADKIRKDKNGVYLYNWKV